MGKKYLKIISIVVSLILLSSSIKTYATEVEDTEATEEVLEKPEPVTPGEWPSGPSIESLSGVVMNVDTGTVLYEKSPEEKHYPASITKIMTALVALENSKLDEKVEFSRYAVYSIEKGSSSISRDEGEVMTMEQCLYGLMLESANECGNAIAEHVAGDVNTFVDMMNEKAKELGCVNTHFANPHGLHDENHYTCAGDMALIARAAYQNPTFALITGTKNYTITPTNKHEEPTPLNNHHAMLNYYKTNKYLYDYCVGGKTGYTSNALGTLVTYAKKDDITLVCVTMCAAGSGHYNDTRRLLDYYFSKLFTTKLGDLDENISHTIGQNISMLMGNDEIPFEIDEDAILILPEGAELSQVQSEFVKSDAKGNPLSVGGINFSYKGKNIGVANIYGKEVESYQFTNTQISDTDDNKENYVVINILRIILIAVAIIAVILFIAYAILRTNTAFAVAKRKRIENRDPHKNMRRIRRRRKRRRERE